MIGEMEELNFTKKKKILRTRKSPTKYKQSKKNIKVGTMLDN